MIIHIEPTTRIVDLNGGLQARVWQGQTDAGVECYLLVTRVAVHRDADSTDFEAALVEQEPPSAAAVEAFPLRMVL